MLILIISIPACLQESCKLLVTGLGPHINLKCIVSNFIKLGFNNKLGCKNPVESMILFFEDHV